MLMDIIIRPERPEDRSRAFELVKAAFADVSESDHTFDAPDECCLAVEPVPGGLSGVDGMVRYPEAFGL